LYSFLILRKDAEACEDAGAVLIVALEIVVVGFLADLLVCCFFGFVFVAAVVDGESDVDVDDDAVLVTAGTIDEGFSSDEAIAKNVSKRAETRTTLPILRRNMVSRARDYKTEGDCLETSV
jgi:hypothetical protein